MQDASKRFFYEMLCTPSPTGWEQPLQRKIQTEFHDVAHVVEPDIHGNLTLSINPGAKRKVMLAGHCDQIGFLVKYISPEGYIYLDKVGGADSGVVLGERLVTTPNTPTAPNASSSLPHTGAAITAMLLLSALTIGLGSIVLVASRRRRRV